MVLHWLKRSFPLDLKSQLTIICVNNDRRAVLVFLCVCVCVFLYLLRLYRAIPGCRVCVYVCVSVYARCLCRPQIMRPKTRSGCFSAAPPCALHVFMCWCVCVCVSTRAGAIWKAVNEDKLWGTASTTRHNHYFAQVPHDEKPAELGDGNWLRRLTTTSHRERAQCGAARARHQPSAGRLARRRQRAKTDFSLFFFLPFVAASLQICRFFHFNSHLFINKETNIFINNLPFFYLFFFNTSLYCSFFLLLLCQSIVALFMKKVFNTKWLKENRSLLASWTTHTHIHTA